MAFDLTGLGSIFDFASKVIDRVIPDPAQKAAAQLEVLKLAQNGELEEMKTQMSAIVTEAQSTDPWTSRARPSFLYVMYLMILTSIPMGIVYAFYPAVALGIASGFKQWLTAIPDSLYTLFGVGYLGYAGGRSWEKVRGVSK
jgi:hypothetical protein